MAEIRYDLNTGYPHLSVIPRDALARLSNELICANRGLQYGGDLKGVLFGREAVANFLQRHTDSAVQPSDLILTSGSLQGIDIACRALCIPGDVVAVESPTFFFAISILRMSHVKVIGVPMTPEGIDLDALDALAEKYGARLRMLYTMQTYQNPTGLCTAAAHREKLVALAKRRQFAILEDTAYQFLHYGPPPPPMLRHFDPGGGTVITVGTFSKIIAPSLRQGWLWSTREQTQLFATYKADASASLLTTEMLSEYLKQEDIDAQIAFLQDTYRRRRDKMVEALKQYLPDGAEWIAPQGGFFVWIVLPPHLSATELRALTQAQGMDFMPGQISFAGETADRYVRLCFTYAEEEALDAGIAVLGACLKEHEKQVAR